jgi:hypothetical protein
MKTAKQHRSHVLEVGRPRRYFDANAIFIGLARMQIRTHLYQFLQRVSLFPK